MIEQVAALPYRFDAYGEIEVMLITSLRGQHWIPPKGNLVEGLSREDAAAREAFEEAGLIGAISGKALGRYTARKTDARGELDLDITVFPMLVEIRAQDWPEKGRRSTLWFETQAAASVVRETGLARLIADFRPAPGSDV